jgi:hypothetical protein
VVHEDASHRAGGDAEEVTAVLEVARAAPDQPEPRVVDQRGRLQRVVAPLAGHELRGDVVQLAIDPREERLGRGRVAVAHSPQEANGVRALLHHGRPS